MYEIQDSFKDNKQLLIIDQADYDNLIRNNRDGLEDLELELIQSSLP